MFQQVIVTLFALLDRWRKEASACEKSLDLADHQIRQTMEESEAAVLSIARGFGDIVSKTQKQPNDAGMTPSCSAALPRWTIQ